MQHEISNPRIEQFFTGSRMLRCNIQEVVKRKYGPTSHYLVNAIERIDEFAIIVQVRFPH